MIPNYLNSLWCEKYRPSTLEDINLPEATKKIIESYKDGIPHILMTGSCGLGKTTLAQIIVTSILECDYLYINASDENGIDTIRQKVSGFAQTKSFDGNLKVIILDEGDALTKNAQDALRNLMESYASHVRFIITGNYDHKISTALKSRCTKLELKPSIKEALTRCFFILKQEKIEIPEDQKKLLAKLVKTYFPDMRICINEMQRCSKSGVLDITERNTNEELCEYIFESIINKKVLNLRKYIIERESSFNNDYEQLLKDLLNCIYTKEIDETTKKTYILIIAEHLYKASLVLDKEINTFACLLALEDV